MYARFTERARQVVVLAQDAARELGHLQIGTEHVLLGLLAERKGLAASTLESLGVDLEEASARLARLVRSGEGPTVGQLPFTSQARCVVELANVEVECRRLNFVATEHVLLGLVVELETDPDNDVALNVLSELKVTPEQIRSAVERFVPVRAGGLSWMLRRTPGLEFRGVRAAGWIDVLSLVPQIHLRRLLIRAAAVAMDADRAVCEARDLLSALRELPEGAGLLSASSELPQGAELLRGFGVTPARSEGAGVGPKERDWTRIDASDQVIAALMGAQRRALDQQHGTVTLDDLLRAVVVDQASLLSQSGWDVGALRAVLERRAQQSDAA